MTIDFRDEERDLRELLTDNVRRRATSYVPGRSRPITAVEVGYEFDQRGWLFVYFDTRATHGRDGEWTRFLDDKHSRRGFLERPHWHAAFMTLEPVTVVLTDGTEESLGEVTAPAFAEILGEFVRDVVLRLKDEGIFDPLPKSDGCQLDIEDFNGRWVWPEFYDLGKLNLL